jgi:hypothetical protein
MTDDDAERFMSSRGFLAYVESDLFANLSDNFFERLDAGEVFTGEQAALHFNLPFEIFRLLFAHYLAASKIQEEAGTRH